MTSNERNYIDKAFDWDEELVLDDAKAIARFYQTFKVPKSKKSCWEFIGGTTPDKNGYPRFFFSYVNDEGKTKTIFMRSARVAYTIYHGKSPGNQMVLHTCDNENCLAKHHLYLGDAQQNANDRGERTGYDTLARGDDHPNRKITKEQALEIIKLGHKLVSAREIKKILKLDMTISSINAIVRGQSWAHLGKRKSKMDIINAKHSKIFAMLLEGHSFKKVAKRFKMNCKYLRELCKRKGVVI